MVRPGRESHPPNEDEAVEHQPEISLWRRVRSWMRRRAPLVSRRRHATELQAVESAAQQLCTAVQDATRASVLALEQWQLLAQQSLRERDEALAEVERLRATVAELVLKD